MASPKTSTAEPAPTDWRTLALDALRQLAATGDPKSIRLLTDGTAEKLCPPPAPPPAVPSHAEHRERCPNCARRLRVRWRRSGGRIDIALIDDTSPVRPSDSPYYHRIAAEDKAVEAKAPRLPAQPDTVKSGNRRRKRSD